MSLWGLFGSREHPDVAKLRTLLELLEKRITAIEEQPIPDVSSLEGRLSAVELDRGKLQLETLNLMDKIVHQMRGRESKRVGKTEGVPAEDPSVDRVAGGGGGDGHQLPSLSNRLRRF